MKNYYKVFLFYFIVNLEAELESELEVGADLVDRTEVEYPSRNPHHQWQGHLTNTADRSEDSKTFVN